MARRTETRQGEWNLAYTPAQNAVALPRGVVLRSVEAHSEGAGGTTAQLPMYLYVRVQVGSAGQNRNLCEGWTFMNASRAVIGISWEGAISTDTPNVDQVSLIYGGYGTSSGGGQVYRVTWSWDDDK